MDTHWLCRTLGAPQDLTCFITHDCIAIAPVSAIYSLGAVDNYLTIVMCIVVNQQTKTECLYLLQL